MTRARYGVPHGKLAGDDEAAAVAAVRAIIELINANKFDAATKAAAAADKRWPNLPGVAAARCDLDVKRRDTGGARAWCARAIAHNESSWGLYLSAILDLQDTNAAGTAKGIAHLRDAIALDPELGQAWRALGRAFERAKAMDDLAKLRRDYETRFGTPLQ
jgi:predicted Zn-dependent protease